jgi:hypothetical protein
MSNDNIKVENFPINILLIDRDPQTFKAELV